MIPTYTLIPTFLLLMTFVGVDLAAQVPKSGKNSAYDNGSRSTSRPANSRSSGLWDQGLPGIPAVVKVKRPAVASPLKPRFLLDDARIAKDPRLKSLQAKLRRLSVELVDARKKGHSRKSFRTMRKMEETRQSVLQRLRVVAKTTAHPKQEITSSPPNTGNSGPKKGPILPIPTLPKKGKK